MNMKSRGSLQIIILFCFLMFSLLSGCTGMKDVTGYSGANSYRNGDYETAIRQYKEAYYRMERSNNVRGMAINAVNISVNLFLLKDYKMSREWVAKAKKLAESIDYALVLGASLDTLSDLQIQAGEFQEAILSSKWAVNLLNKPQMINTANLTMGESYALSGDHKTAVDYLRRVAGSNLLADIKKSYGLKIYELNKNKYDASLSYAEGYRAFEEAEYQTAIKKFEKALSIYREREYHAAVLLSMIRIGNSYVKLHKKNEALGYFNQALEYGSSYSPKVLNSNLEDISNLKVFIASAKSLQEEPCDLIVEVKKFDDSNAILPNQILDAGEEALLTVSVKNIGKGVGYETKLELLLENSSITINEVISIGNILQNETKEVTLKLKAGLDIDSGKTAVGLLLRENRGYDAKKVIKYVSTARLLRPQLEIISAEPGDGEIGLAKGNGNGIPENGETIELTVLIRNNGEGKAIGVDLNVDKKDIGIQWLRDSAHVATIQPGAIEKAKLAFLIPRSFDAKDIAASLKVSDARGVNEADRKVVLSYIKRSPSIQTFIKVASSGAQVDTLANGQTYELDVTLSNKGEIPGRNVEASIFADRGIGLSETTIHISEIKAGESVSKRITLSVPRTFAEKQAQLNVEVSQTDFPSVKDTINYAVDLRSPRLTYSATLQGRTGENALEQGESSVLEVQVLNDGNLSANGVKVIVRSKDENLKLVGQTEPLIGVLPANTRSETIKFPVSTLRRIKAGDALLDINITQDDFQAIGAQYAINIVEEGAVVVDVESEGRKISRSVAKAQSGPSIVFRGVQGDLTTEEDSFSLAFEVEDARNIEEVRVRVNGMVIPVSEFRGQKRVVLQKAIPLREGGNKVEVSAYNANNAFSKKELIVTRVVEDDVDTPPITGTREPNAIAVVIGVSKYESKDVPPVDYARKDATTVRNYLVQTLGFEPKNIIELYDEDAKLTRFNYVFRTKLKNMVAAGKSEVFVFYSGHGVPEDKEPYFAPYDLIPEDIKTSGYAVNDLYKQLADLKAKSVTVVMDACFSGASGGEESRPIIKNASPVFLEVSSPMLGINNGVAFSSSSGRQLSSWYRKKQHGIFTYYFLLGLRGKADFDADGSITAREMEDYLTKNVPEKAMSLYSREQRPEVTGAKDKILRRLE